MTRSKKFRATLGSKKMKLTIQLDKLNIPVYVEPEYTDMSPFKAPLLSKSSESSVQFMILLALFGLFLFHVLDLWVKPKLIVKECPVKCGKNAKCNKQTGQCEGTARSKSEPKDAGSKDQIADEDNPLEWQSGSKDADGSEDAYVHP